MSPWTSDPHSGRHDPATDPDLGTDPGRPHPYESLYRSAPGEIARPSRPTPRHFEQHLSRPDGAQEGFGWLYRTEPDPVVAPPAVPPPDRPPPARPGLRRVVILVIVVLLVGAAAGIGVGVALARRAASPEPTRTAAPSTSVPAASAPLASAPADRLVTAASATVSCQAPPATDDAGQPVTYAPGNLLDGDPETAWRCDGAGLGQTVVFTFAAPTSVSQVAMINGYAKVDPTSRAPRYPEYRRVTRASWTFAGGTTVVQELADGTQAAQSIDFPSQQTSQITLRIEATTTPGSTLATRDAVLISEVTFAA